MDKRIGLTVLRSSGGNVDADDLESILAVVIERLSPLGKARLFTLSFADVAIRLPASDDNRGYSDDTLWELLEPVRVANGWNHIIGVTAEYLEFGSFNRENKSRSCGVVTVSEWAEFLPTGLDKCDYLTYLVVCVCSLMCAPTNFEEHDASGSCLFDICPHRRQFTRSLSASSVAHCHDRLVAPITTEANTGAAWTPKQVKELERVLKSVRRRDPFLVMAASGSATGPFLLGVAVSLSCSLVAGFAPRWGAIIACVLVAGSLWVGASKLASAQYLGLRRKRSRSMALIALLPVLLGMGAYAGSVVKIPTPETVRIERVGPVLPPPK